MRFLIVRLNRQRSVVTGQGLFVALELDKDVAAIVERIGMARTYLQSRGDQVERFFRATLLRSKNAEKMAGLEVLRLGPQDVPIELFRVGKPPLLMQADRRCQHFRQIIRLSGRNRLGHGSRLHRIGTDG
jgi:hypothetical protein